MKRSMRSASTMPDMATSIETRNRSRLDGSPDQRKHLRSTTGRSCGHQGRNQPSRLLSRCGSPIHRPRPQAVSDFRHLWGKSEDGKECWTVSTTAEIGTGLTLRQHGTGNLRSAYRSSQWRSASIGSTGRRCPSCFPVSFPGVKTSRDGFLVDTDLDRLKARIGDYFNAVLSHEEIGRRYPRVMKSNSAVRCPRGAGYLARTRWAG